MTRSPILDYAVQYRTGGGAWILVDPAVSGVIITGLTNGDSYEFQVQARNAIGASPWSTSAYATPQTVPGIPQNLQAAAGDGQVTLTWSAPASNGGSAILDYAYDYREAGGTWSAPITAASGVVVSGLTNGTAYEFRVRARNANGSSPWLEPPVSATPRTVPGAPTLTSATPGNQQVTLVWAAPASDGGAAIDYYRCGLRASNCGNEASWTNSGTSAGLSLIVGSLANGTLYQFRVLAHNTAGTGDPSNILSATPTNPAVPPGAPQNVEDTSGNGQIALTWLAPSSDGRPHHRLRHRVPLLRGHGVVGL